MPNINDTKLVITNETSIKALQFTPYTFIEDGWVADLTKVSMLYHAGQPITISDYSEDQTEITAGSTAKFIYNNRYTYFEFDGGEQNNTLSGAIYELNLAVNCQ
jgi:hypothetical protein